MKNFLTSGNISMKFGLMPSNSHQRYVIHCQQRERHFWTLVSCLRPKPFTSTPNHASGNPRSISSFSGYIKKSIRTLVPSIRNFPSISSLIWKLLPISSFSNCLRSFSDAVMNHLSFIERTFSFFGFGYCERKASSFLGSNYSVSQTYDSLKVKTSGLTYPHTVGRGYTYPVSVTA